ncbi:MAG TPA: hypothetical protein PK760_04875 [Flavobacteriales bacterium]|nr:hypothetical protein [Flavobacteriales bacterium]
MDFQALYTNLGYLFYSVAAADGRVRPVERDALMAMVKERWLPLEGSRDEMGTDQAHYIDIAFDHANENHMSGDEAFGRFAVHMEKHALELGPRMRGMIHSTAASIAGAFAANNKAELTRLAQLQELFHRYPDHVVTQN